MRPLALWLLACFACLGAAASALAAFDPVPRNPANRLLSVPIDDERYDHATRCRSRPMRGTRALEAWLDRYARGGSWGIMRCEKLGRGNYSLHAEGRALDWNLDAGRSAERREAERIIALLLAPDRRGNERALARRMGIQEIIYNCRSWFSGMDRMKRYSACYDRRGRRRKRVNRTIAHRDHIHFGLSRRGGAGRTSYWKARSERLARRRISARRR